jgi:hypothetical protein
VFLGETIARLTGYVGQESNLGGVSDGQRRSKSDSLSMVCKTTAFPNPNGICTALGCCQTIWGVVFRTILNQSLAGLEFSFMVDISIAAMKGKIPNVRLMVLYFPVRCIDHLRVLSERKVNECRNNPHTQQIWILSTWRYYLATGEILNGSLSD